MASETASSATGKRSPSQPRRAGSDNGAGHGAGPVRDARPERRAYEDGGATDVAERAAEALEGGEGLGRLSPRDLVAAFGRTVGRPGPLTSEGARLVAEVAKVAVGRSEVAPAKNDWRFKDPAWTDNPLYRRVAET